MEQLSSWLMQFLQSDTVVLLGAVVVLLVPIEWVFAARPIPLRHYGFNVVYGFSIVLIGALLAPLTSTATAYAVQKLGFGFIDLSALGLGGWGGSLLAVLIASLIFDFFFYWLHRLEHASLFLWQEHVVHHSDEYLNVTTGARGHIAEIFLAPIFVTVPIAILFKLPAVTIGILSILPLLWFYVGHMNVKLRFGPLWWLLVSPDYHRIHHSLERKHFNKNFVNFFPIWDIVFGTAWNPKKGECPATGVAGVTLNRVVSTHLFPFAAWRKMMTASGKSGAVQIQDAGRSPAPAPRSAARSTAKKRRARS